MDLTKPFKFRLSTNLNFGIDKCLELGQEIKNLEYRSAAVIVDYAVFEHPQVKKALLSLKENKICFDIFKNESVEPTYDYLESFKKLFDGKKYDCLVGIGGGSCLDLTKGIAVLLNNEGPAIAFRGFPKLQNKPVPSVLIPTTAGTGSEVTYNAVFTDAKEKRKLGINSIYNFPVCAIIDPLITVDCPRKVTVSSGADALVHSLESYAHKDHTPLSRMFSKEAFRLLYNNLMKVLDEPQNVSIRSGLALGAHFAGIALINAGSGPAGAFSYPLGAVYKVPHGYAGALFLSSITRINVEKGYRDYSSLYDFIEGVNIDINMEKKNKCFVEKIQELMDKLDIPKNLSYFNLNKADVQFMIEQYDGLKTAIAQNPVEITRQDVTEMMHRLA